MVFNDLILIFTKTCIITPLPCHTSVFIFRQLMSQKPLEKKSKSSLELQTGSRFVVLQINKEKNPTLNWNANVVNPAAIVVLYS